MPDQTKTQAVEHIVQNVDIIRKDTLYPLVLTAFILVIWEATTVIFGIKSIILPKPSAIAAALMNNYATLMNAAIETLQYILIGFGIGSLFGLVMGITIASSKIIKRAFYPVLVISFVVPKIVLAPLILLWFGAGPIYFTFMPLLLVFFPVLENTVTGIEGVKSDMKDLARLFQSSRTFKYTHIVIPASIPHIMAGLKIGMTQAIIGVIVAEFVAPKRGLGYLLLLGEQFGNTQFTFATIVVTALLGIALYKMMEIIEQWVFLWREGGIE